MSDRLRRLDNLFAERVLGCKIRRHESKVSGNRGVEPWIMIGCGCGDNSHNHHEEEGMCGLESKDSPDQIIHPDGAEGITNYTIAHYTRSLDLAWEGANKIDQDDCHFMEIMHNTGKTWRVQFGCRLGPNGEVSVKPVRAYAVADHPAEALVIASLRAVGCTEEELA